MNKRPVPFDLGPVHFTLAQAAYGGGNVAFDAKPQGPHEAAFLTLDASKAEQALGVTPRLRLADAIGRTMAWYRAHSERGDALGLCRDDIAAYEALA